MLRKREREGGGGRGIEREKITGSRRNILSFSLAYFTLQTKAQVDQKKKKKQTKKPVDNVQVYPFAGFV